MSEVVKITFPDGAVKEFPREQQQKILQVQLVLV